MAHTPLVSIGLPVRNGGRFLQETLTSLLQQTLGEFELIISDNASTDDTGPICKELTQTDPRIRYYRQDRNIGGPGNWNFVFRKARAPYFKWASANDLCAPDFLVRCLNVMESNERVVLAFPQTALIDADGAITGRYEEDPDLSDPDPLERFRSYILHMGLNNAQQGVIRSSALRETGLERNYQSGDLPLMAELALLGEWRMIPEPLLLRRMAAETHVIRLPVSQRRTVYYPGASRVYLPFLRPYLAYWGVVGRSKLSVRRKLQLWYALMRLLRWRRKPVMRDIRALLAGRAAYAEEAVQTAPSEGEKGGE